MPTTQKLLFGVLMLAVLTACGGGGGDNGTNNGNGPGLDTGAANQAAILSSTNTAARAAVAAQQLAVELQGFADLFDDAGESNSAPLCGRSGSVQVQRGNDPSTARLIFNNCRMASDDGSDLQADGNAIVQCNRFSGVDCVDITLDFGENGFPLILNVFSDASTTTPSATFGALGPLSSRQDGSVNTTTLNTDFSGRIAGTPQITQSIVTQGLQVTLNNGLSPATLSVAGALGLTTNPDTGNCQQGLVQIATSVPLTAPGDVFENGFDSGELMFSAGGQSASAIYNADGSINVTDDSGNAQLVSTADAAGFCTFGSPLF